MMELELWIQTAGAFFAILGFSFILDAPRRFLLYTGLSGAVGWLAYLLTQRGEHEVIMAAFQPCDRQAAESPCDRVSCLRYPAGCSGRIDLQERILSDRGREDAGQLLSDGNPSGRRSDGAGHFHCGFPVPSGAETGPGDDTEGRNRQLCARLKQ